MEDIYEGMDKEMDEITNKLESLKIDERISEISKKMSNVMKKLEKINKTNKMFNSNSGSIVKWLEQVKKYKGNIKNNQSEIDIKIKGAGNSGFKWQRMGWQLVTFGILVLSGVMGYIVFKAHRIVNSKKMHL